MTAKKTLFQLGTQNKGGAKDIFGRSGLKYMYCPLLRAKGGRRGECSRTATIYRHPKC